jgi:hypothetical protein
MDPLHTFNFNGPIYAIPYSKSEWPGLFGEPARDLDRICLSCLTSPTNSRLDSASALLTVYNASRVDIVSGKVECVWSVASKTNAGDFAHNVLRHRKFLQNPRNTLMVAANSDTPLLHVDADMNPPDPVTVYHLDGHPLVHRIEHSGFPTGDGAPSVLPRTSKVGGDGVGAADEVGAGIEKLEEKLA